MRFDRNGIITLKTHKMILKKNGGNFKSVNQYTEIVKPTLSMHSMQVDNLQMLHRNQQYENLLIGEHKTNNFMTLQGMGLNQQHLYSPINRHKPTIYKFVRLRVDTIRLL